jgi:hypothetical protein
MLPKFIHCESCGMPMIKSKDFGGEDKNNKRCKYCCFKDGSHKSYNEVLEGQINFMLSPKGENITEKKYSTREEARSDAIEYLSKMPTWKN